MLNRIVCEKHIFNRGDRFIEQGKFLSICVCGGIDKLNRLGKTYVVSIIKGLMHFYEVMQVRLLYQMCNSRR